MTINRVSAGSLVAVFPLWVLLWGVMVSGSAAAEEYSGFIKDMPELEEQKGDDGVIARYVSPRLSSGEYTKVLLEPVQIFPEPEPSDKVDAATLKQAEQYLDESMRREVGKRVMLTDTPGPGVVRVRLALTGAKAEAAELKPYQYVPVALLLNVAADAAGVKKKDAKLYGEAELLDSVSGERLGVVVRESRGQQMKQAGDTVTLDSVKPLIDEIAERAAENLARALGGE